MENKDKIIRMPNVDYTPDPGGLGSVFFKKMSSYKNTIAQIDGLTGQKDTYNSLLQRSIRTAITMRSKGITSEDIITICTFNHLNCSVPFIASLFLGARTANLDPTINLKDTIHLLKQVTPKMIFVGPEAINLIEEALRVTGIDSQMVIFGKSKNHLEFEEFLNESPEEEKFKPVEVEDIKDTAIIFFSSGTTGLPKGICVNHFALLTQAHLYGERGFEPKVVLGFASMYWISSVITITTCLLHQGHRILIPRFDPNITWKLISDYKVTSIFIAPSDLIALCKMGRPEGIDTRNLHNLNTGGAPLAREQIIEARKIFPNTIVTLGYGQTETVGGSVLFSPNIKEDMVLTEKKPGASGRALQGFWYKIVDPETEEILGPNQKGELRVKTKIQMNGYYNLKSSNAWDDDGWLKTGDVGYYDEDHCFFIVDRIKEMLKYRSWHVPPALIEGVLLTHPQIKTAVVIGIPHPEDGDHPMAVIVLNNSSNGLSEEEIERYVAQRVDDRQKLRGGVKIVDNIPFTPTGKINRGEVKNLILKGYGK